MVVETARRRFLGASLAGGALTGLTIGGAGLATVFGAEPALAATSAPVQIPDEVVVTAADPRYGYLNTRGQNRRLSGSPASIFQVFTADQVRQAVDSAVRAGQQIAVRSGGHCLDALVDNSSVQALIDVSRMNAVYYDPAHNAFAVESGALLGDVYKQLYLGYGVVIPGGTCPTVGVGGYVQGGGFGALCRQHGLIVDHLYGVEVVVVDATGKSRTVVATRDPADPNHDLWWAHTGAGGGNFGVVTRFLFRSPGATGSNPADLLPKPPAATLVSTVSWPWSTMTEKDFTRLVQNHNSWHAANSADGSPYASLYSALTLGSYAVGKISLVAELDGTLANSADLMSSYLAALTAGTTAPYSVQSSTMPWVSAIFSYLYGGAPSPYNRGKGKGAYLRRPFADGQIATMYRYLSDPTYDGLGSVAMFSYGGKINTVSPSATVAAQRDSILKTYLGANWANPAEDDKHVAWVRAFYRDVFAATGGVPVPNDMTDGSYINYPDVDLADPTWNTSGIPWYTLYFKDNYPRLRQIKAQYDPGDVFRHPLSVRA
ncbi:FAD-binding oxidoreductase [Kitasatospora azatica]|uniref:FAD-binding oxidoreductase n=1 Tax=Kitasatospora azatica TaxID=58347 RepID=UPI000A0715BE|nr:FAD-binding protein [Kitasatospora azatica]